MPPKRLVGGSIPVAQPYEESVIRATLNDIERQASQKTIADSDGFRARARGAPTLTADTPVLAHQQAAAVSNPRPLIQSHSPYYNQQQPLNTNPLDPLGWFSPGGRNPFGWYVPTPPPRPSSRILPLEVPTIEDVEKAVNLF